MEQHSQCLHEYYPYHLSKGPWLGVYLIPLASRWATSRSHTVQFICTEFRFKLHSFQILIFWQPGAWIWLLLRVSITFLCSVSWTYIGSSMRSETHISTEGQFQVPWIGTLNKILRTQWEKRTELQVWSLTRAKLANITLGGWQAFKALFFKKLIAGGLGISIFKMRW